MEVSAAAEKFNSCLLPYGHIEFLGQFICCQLIIPLFDMIQITWLQCNRSDISSPSDCMAKWEQWTLTAVSYRLRCYSKKEDTTVFRLSTCLNNQLSLVAELEMTWCHNSAGTGNTVPPPNSSTSLKEFYLFSPSVVLPMHYLLPLLTTTVFGNSSIHLINMCITCCFSELILYSWYFCCILLNVCFLFKHSFYFYINGFI